MNNFNFYNPTNIIFGKNAIDQLIENILLYGTRVLLVYGKESIKKTGLYDDVINRFKKNNIIWTELSGVQPNPRLKTVRKGARLCTENNIEIILAVGGGSTIDCAKAISVAAPYEGDVWDFYEYKETPKSALPVGTILTASATASEMNENSVISNEVIKVKTGLTNNLLFPKFSILDPETTYTVPKHQLACGIVDTLAHLFEFYFNAENSAELTDRISESIMKITIKYGTIAMKEPENYEARSNLMWASTLALNGLTMKGKVFDGFNHRTEHAISAIYDVTHADGLSVLTPNWLNYIRVDGMKKIAHLGRLLFDIDQVNDDAASIEMIESLSNFYRELGMPKSFADLGIKNPDIDLIVEKAVKNKTLGSIKILDKTDVKKILMNAM